ncbi:MAG: Asp-tRNA(Asn)/Glu-tRNA(Gln) amidotransferase subunit GatC [SAR202 cluster bacterium]|nr:Asp-tRNA(Asn)/Glu-tRNA(Gln) amidotransferase subunit GatC [SAR202 cluster bacterium]
MLTSDDVRRVARLTRIALSDTELTVLQDQLSKVLGHFQSLQMIDTEGTEPTGHASEGRTVMRDDLSAPSLARSDVLKNAPESDEPMVRVRPVLGS